MAEWSIAAVLKTVELRGSGGSNPSLSANKGVNQQAMRFTPFAISKSIYRKRHSCGVGTLVIFQPWNVCFPADGKVAFLGWNTYLSQ